MSDDVPGPPGRPNDEPQPMTTREMHQHIKRLHLVPFTVMESLDFCRVLRERPSDLATISLPFDPFALGLCYLETEEWGFKFVLAKHKPSTADSRELIALMVGHSSGTEWTEGPAVADLEQALTAIDGFWWRGEGFD